jgi:hypothetical protein
MSYTPKSDGCPDSLCHTPRKVMGVLTRSDSLFLSSNSDPKCFFDGVISTRCLLLVGVNTFRPCGGPTATR